MILGPLKSSQAGNRLQAKHCVRSANVPASPHHQKPVESSPSRPPRSTLSLLPRLIKEAEVANIKIDDPPVRTIPSSQATNHQFPKGFISPDPRARGFIFYTQVHLSSSLHDVHHGLALPEQEDTHEEVQQVVRASILAAPGAQCRLMCCTAAHKIEQPHHACVCQIRFTTDGARLQEDSSSSRLILDSSPASDPEEGEGSRLRKPIICIVIPINNCLFSSVSNLQ